VKCPECVASDQTSKVYDRGSISHLLGWSPYRTRPECHQYVLFMQQRPQLQPRLQTALPKQSVLVRQGGVRVMSAAAKPIDEDGALRPALQALEDAVGKTWCRQ